MNRKQIQGITLAVLMVVSVFAFVNPAAAATSTNVTLTPDDASLTEGEQTQFEIVVDEVDGGVGTYDVDLTLSNTNAEITDITLEVKGSDAFTEKSISDDGSSAHAETLAADTDDSTTDLTVLTVTVEGVSAGTSELDLTVNSLGDEAGSSYDETVDAASTIEITEQSSEFDLSYEVSSTTVGPGDDVTLTATVENTGTAEGTQTVEFKADGEVFDTQDVTVAADETKEVSASTNFDAVGDYDVTVNDLAPTTIQVTTEAPPHDATIVEGVNDGNNPGLIFKGQRVLVEGLSPNQDVQLRRGDDASSTYVDAATTDAAGRVTFATANRETGDYFVRDLDTGTNTYFELVSQSLSVSTDQGSVVRDTETQREFTIATNRPGEFVVTVSEEDLSQENLLTIFPGATAVDDTKVQFTVDDGDTLVGEFPATVPTGDYSFNFDVADTTAADTADLSVSATGAASVSFAQATVSEQIGDEAEITVDMENTDEATLIIGSADAGYQADLLLTNDDDDSSVTVQFNTYAAGRDKGKTVTAVGDDGVTLQDETALSNLLASGSYTLRIATGHDTATTADSPDRLGSLSLTARETRSMDLWTAPADVSVEDLADLNAAIDDETVTKDSSIATGDTMVMAINVQGIQGILASTEGDSVRAKLLNTEALSLSATQTNTDRNQAAKALDFTEMDFSVLNDEDNDVLYVIVDTDDTVLAAGDEFEATFTLNKGYVAAAEDESVTGAFDMLVPDATVDTNAQGNLVLAAENETITGTSTMAPGSSFTVRVESQSNQDPFIERGQATVEPDGTWSTEIDLTDADPGTPLEIQVRSGTEGQVADIQGTIGSVGTISFGDVSANPATVRPGGAVEIMSTVSNPGDTSVEKSVEVMVDGEMVDEKTISLDSGESMDVTYVISTRDLSTGDHTATLAVGDSSGEVSFTIEEEETRTPRPTATDTIAPPPTATPTEASTPTPEEVTVVVTETVEVTQEPTEEPTTTDGGDGPGFGIAVALVALLAAAFLAVRRQD